jgi:alkylresorcinol/alkylpyrone synthase
MVYISGIGISCGKNKVSTEDYINKFCELNINETDKKFIKKFGKNPGIKYRNFEYCNYEDLLKLDIQERNKISNDVSKKLIFQCINNCLKNTDNIDISDITHVLTCTTTTNMCPSLDSYIINKFNLPNNTKRYNMQNLGCAGGGAAIDLGYNICKGNNNNIVLIVCCDVASPYLLRKKYTTISDYISEILFSDGAGCILLSNDHNHGLSINNKKMKISDTKSYTIYDSYDKMNIKLGNNNMTAKLDKDVHHLISTNLHNIMNINNEYDYLLHPGGKSILNEIKKMGIDTNISDNVLLQNGNMSSSTILFVLYDYFYNNSSYKNHFYISTFGQGVYINSVLVTFT